MSDETLCSPRVRALFSSRAEARAEMDRLRAVIKGQGGLMGSPPRDSEKRRLSDCYEYVAMTSSNPSYELREAARLRAEADRG